MQNAWNSFRINGHKPFIDKNQKTKTNKKKTHTQNQSVNKIVFIFALNWQRNRWQLSCSETLVMNSCLRVILVFHFDAHSVSYICSCRCNRMIIRQLLVSENIRRAIFFPSLVRKRLIDLLCDTTSCFTLQHVFTVLTEKFL